MLKKSKKNIFYSKKAKNEHSFKKIGYLCGRNFKNIFFTQNTIYKKMRKLAYTLSTIAALAMGSQAFAQASTSCTVTAPEVQSGLCAYPIGGTVWTPQAPTSVTAVGLPNVEYLITKRGTFALDAAGNRDTTGGGGHVVLGADSDGIFDPSTMSRYGISIAAGDTFDVMAVGYNLPQIKTIVNKIFTGITLTQAPCCAVIDIIANGFCDTLRAQGIDGQEDVNRLADVINVFDAFSDRQLSAESLLSSMNLVNAQGTPQSLFPDECGKIDLPICYGLNRNQRYGYVASSTIAVNKLSDVANFLVFPNPSNTGSVTVSIDTKVSTDMNIRLFNALGATIHTEQLYNVNGAINVNFSTNNLSAGVYFIELSDGKASQTSKVIIR